jgi:hypothetical protein
LAKAMTFEPTQPATTKQGSSNSIINVANPSASAESYEALAKAMSFESNQSTTNNTKFIQNGDYDSGNYIPRDELRVQDIQEEVPNGKRQKQTEEKDDAKDAGNALLQAGDFSIKTAVEDSVVIKTKKRLY